MSDTLSWVLGIGFVFIYVMLILVTVAEAAGKGYSKGLAFAVCIFTSPIIGILLFSLLPDRMAEERRRDRLQARLESIEAKVTHG